MGITDRSKSLYYSLIVAKEKLIEASDYLANKK